MQKWRTVGLGLIVARLAACGGTDAANLPSGTKDAEAACTASTCDDNNACTTDSCDPDSGVCSHVTLSDGTSCTDLGVCLVGGACKGGVCTGGQDVLWTRTFGSAEKESASDIVATRDGGLVVIGSKQSTITGEGNVWLVRISQTGALMWDRTYPGNEVTYGGGIVQTSDDGFAFFSANGAELRLTRVDSDGNENWTRKYGEARGVGGIVGTNDGGFALGLSVAITANDDNFWLLRTDASGSKLWDRNFGDKYEQHGEAIVQTSDGGFALGGRTFSHTMGDGWLVRTDEQGNALWEHEYGTALQDSIDGMALTSDGGFALVGLTIIDIGVMRAWFVRTDANGTELWRTLYGVSNETNAYSVIQNDDGGFFLAGETSQKGAGSQDVWLVRTDSKGATVADWTFGTAASESGYVIAKVGTHGLAITGPTSSNGGDYFVVRTDLFGNTSCATSGACVSKTVSACDDGDPCTRDGCTVGKCTNVKPQFTSCPP